MQGFILALEGLFVRDQELLEMVFEETAEGERVGRRGRSEDMEKHHLKHLSYHSCCLNRE